MLSSDRSQIGTGSSNSPRSANESAVAAISGEQREMTGFVARFERPTEPEREEYRRHSTLCECFSPRGHSLVRFRNYFG